MYVFVCEGVGVVPKPAPLPQLQALKWGYTVGPSGLSSSQGSSAGGMLTLWGSILVRKMFKASHRCLRGREVRGLPGCSLGPRLC